MDKNTVIGFILIIAVVIGFTMYQQPSQEERAKLEQQDSLKKVQEKQVLQDVAKADSAEKANPTAKEGNVEDFFAVQTSEQTTTSTDSVTTKTDSLAAPVTALEEKIISIENKKLKVDVSTKGGQIVNVQLKGYTNYLNDSLCLFANKGSMSLQLRNKSGKALNTSDVVFAPIVGQDGRTVTMRMAYADGKHIDFAYALDEDSYMIDFDIVATGMEDILHRETMETFTLAWKQLLTRKEKSIKNEQRYSQVYYKLQGQDVDYLSESKNIEKEEIATPVKWVAFKDQFFASALIGDNAFETSVLSSKVLDKNEEYLKDYAATLYSPVSRENDGTLKVGYTLFTGPLEYYMLKGYDDNIKDNDKKLSLDELIPLGWSLFRIINKYFIIPLFSMLNSTGMSIGLVIFILTLIVKLLISPLTFKSFMSSAKMRVLRPQVEELNKKFPKPDQAMDKQKATMDLYSKAGASPMAGCIPMLLQMPILLALFSFFPSAIQLRHQGFLWADDLSTYDAIFEWTGNIPLITWALGNHISLFCLLMTATNIVYTKFNMDATNTGQQQMPGMKYMMYLMPLVFLFVLNDFPSGLTYYYFISTLITILLTLGFRYAVNEEKVLAKLEANKLKPKKKSGFMARLEEAQRLQQQQAKGNAKKKK